MDARGPSDTLELTVAEAPRSDVGLGRARIDEATRRLLEIEPGESIEIIGGKSTVASVVPTEPAEEGEKAIRIDGFVRTNASVHLGERVAVRKAVVHRAEEIVLAPVIGKGHAVTFGGRFETFVKRGLLSRPVRQGDVIIVPGIALIGGALPFNVVHTKPEGNVRILDETVITLRDEPFRGTEGLGPEELYTAFVDRVAESLSSLAEEFEEPIAGLAGDRGERARSLLSRVHELQQDLQKDQSD